MQEDRFFFLNAYGTKYFENKCSKSNTHVYRLTASSRRYTFLPIFVASCAAQNRPMDFDSLHTHGFHETSKYAFVTRVART